jgi:hypothetical protein
MTELYSIATYAIDGLDNLEVLAASETAHQADLQFTKTMDINGAFNAIELEVDNDGVDITTGTTTALYSAIAGAMGACSLEYYATAVGTRFEEGKTVASNATEHTGTDITTDTAADLTGAGSNDFGVDSVDEPDIMAASCGYAYAKAVHGPNFTVASRATLNAVATDFSDLIADEADAAGVNGLGASTKWITKLLMDAMGANKTDHAVSSDPSVNDKIKLNLSAGDSVFLHWQINFLKQDGVTRMTVTSSGGAAFSLSSNVDSVNVSLRLEQSA